MSDPLATSLSRFTPDASGLDRDALLFAAGQASVCPNRRWIAVAGTLAASQLLTLSLLWYRPAAPNSSPTQLPIVLPNPKAPDEREPPRDTANWWTLRERILDAEGDLPSPPPAEALTPSIPPLHAFTAPPSALFE